MHPPILLPIIFGKLLSFVSRILNVGAGATWPGEIALRINPRILSSLSSQLKKGIILVAGTNGKTTTAFMIKTILEAQGFRIVHNASGANLLNGIVSALINSARWDGSVDADWGVFEVDENTLPIVIKFIKSLKLKVVIVLLNLFRDQLDRYGEVDVIAEKWEKALESLRQSFLRETSGQAGQALESQDRKTRKTIHVEIIANADDPLVTHLGKVAGTRPGLEARVSYFGLSDPGLFQKKMEHATDSIFCLNCGGRLTYEGIYYSHIGIWYCTKCKEKRPIPDVSDWKSPLHGLYNQYNTLAAVSVAKVLKINDKDIRASLASFQPAFGRQEEFIVNGKKVKIFLSKNPAGFNQSLKTVLELGATQLLFVLNDRIPDGRDVSWIWDVDFELLKEEKAGRHKQTIFVSGERCYDMAVRLKYADIPLPESQVFENLEKAVRQSLKQVNTGETLYILPTYSAMLETRKILTGKKIL